jgi:hypothetical protein
MSSMIPLVSTTRDEGIRYSRMRAAQSHIGPVYVPLRRFPGLYQPSKLLNRTSDPTAVDTLDGCTKLPSADGTIPDAGTGSTVGG